MDMNMDMEEEVGMDIDIDRGNVYATMMMKRSKEEVREVQGRSQVIERPRQKESAAHRACRFEALQAGSGFGRRNS